MTNDDEEYIDVTRVLWPTIDNLGLQIELPEKPEDSEKVTDDS